MSARSTKSLRVGLIGPLLPFRGGIAQHTTMLHRVLRNYCELLTISFQRQYPQWLYPGKGDVDPEYAGHREPGVVYRLDPLNPRTWIETCHAFHDHGAAAVVIPWWTVFWMPCLGTLAKLLTLRSIRVIFCCHNVIEHEASWWKTLATRWVLTSGSGFVTHTHESAARLAAMVPNAAIVVYPHPTYDQFPSARGLLPRRAGLEMLFFGFVRYYKGLDVLIEALRLLPGEDLFLTVAGEWWIRDVRLVEKIALDGRIEVVNRFLRGQEVAEYFQRADVVVLPYRSATGTGIIPLARRYRKSVIATRVGGLAEAVAGDDLGRLVPPEDPGALAQAIRELLSAQSSPPASQDRVPAGITWDGLATAILSLMSSEVLGCEGQGPRHTTILTAPRRPDSWIRRHKEEAARDQ